MSDFIVGLTGGIASGKSEAGRRFEALGITVVDADAVAREVVEPGPTLSRIAERFGPGILQIDGRLDRRALRELVFADPELRRALEAITHPEIRLRLRQACEAAIGPYAIAAIPLLAEAGGRTGYPWLDRILVVDAPMALQRQRLMLRDNIDASLADRMIAAQASREQRLALADDVIVNDGDAEALGRLVAALDGRYRGLAASKTAG
ncbi:dephospho-CoA kinase [[Pseudomonas] boreopolis]|uniref:dephospho-CoA kinase n=1 Tax=Xanthomonas boreopolis TaxID=86183 RepID=UPI003D5D39B8